MQFGVSESIAHWAKYRPKSPAVVNGQTTVSFADLNSLVDTICRKAEPIAQQHERIAVATQNKLLYLASLVASLRCGCAVVVINTGLEDSAIAKTLSEASVDALLVDGSNARLTDHLPSGDRYVIDIEALTASGVAGGYEYSRERKPSDEWGVLYSSGTTGIPKGIERSHESIVTELLGWCLELGLTRHTRFYIGRPIFYTGGLVLSLATLLVGGTTIINDFGDDNDNIEIWEDYQRVLQQSAVSWAFFVPSQIRDFTLRAMALSASPLGAQSILVMGAPITGQEKVLAKQQLGSQIVESWGNTESLGTITDPEDLDTRPDSIGRPFLTDVMSVVDDECNDLAAGELGWLAGSEEAGFTRYCQRDEDTRRVKRDELILSEDLGYLDADGYFYIRGRNQESIVTDTDRVFLPEIEQKIRLLDEVEDCCVLAIGESGDEVSLVGVLVCCDTSKVDAGELLNTVNAALTEGERLTRLRIVLDLPRLPSGKVDRLKAGTDYCEGK